MRFLAIQPDPVAGGSTHDQLTTNGTVAPAWPALSGLYPVTTANVEPNIEQINRDDDVTGLGASQAPETLSSAAEVNFEMRAYPAVVHRILRDILKGSATPAGTTPAAITTTVEAAQSGAERCSIATLVREGQIDRVSGVAWNELELELPIDDDAQITATGLGLYHESDVEPALSMPTDQPTGHVYKLRDVQAYLGPGSGTVVDCLSGFGLTITANVSDDAEDRFCAGKNIEVTTINGQRYKVWYPHRHQRKGKREVTARIDFTTTRPDQELARILSRADRLRVEIAGALMGTTPAADEMLRLILHRIVPNGGGAGELNADDSQRSSYEYGVYIDPSTSKDIQAEIVSSAAIA